MRFTNRLLTLTTAGALACLGGQVATVSHAAAATACDDGGGNEYMEVPILSSPITLAAEVGDGYSLLDPHVGLCFGTNSEAANAAGQPELAGGAIFVDALNPASNDGFSTGAAVLWDTNSDIRAGAVVGATPTYTVQPGGTGGGQTITVNLPFSLCVGPCTTNPGVSPYTTGLVVGSLTQVPPPTGGQSAAYQLNSVCLYVDGVQVDCLAGPTAGATTGGAPGLFIADGGPCLNSLCLPVTGNSTIGLSPAQEATLYVPGLNPIPIGTGRVCYQATSSSPACP